GPRFTTVIDLPYDRDRTTMVDFPLCRNVANSCYSQYHDVNDRRFHAQTFACPACGPHYFLMERAGKILARGVDCFRAVANSIKKGLIVAMKGIGGVHLVVDATNTDAIKTLRARKKKRKYKPFALMAPDLESIKENAFISKIEEKIIQSHRRPIILLRRKASSKISELVAPGLSTLGFMLPYMGSHHLLFKYAKSIGLGPLIFTSGNISGLPMAIRNEDITKQLKVLADLFLLHDRRIYQRCDDSLGKVISNNFMLIRRSRGWVPEFVPSPIEIGDSSIIAVGPELHVTAAVFKGNKIFPSQYIGNVVNLETLDFLKSAIEHFSKLLRLNKKEISAVACDAHPLFHSTGLAESIAGDTGATLFRILHHHAHCASLLLDNRLNPEEHVLYITTDGVGYGADGNAWGGEMFIGPLLKLSRVCHLAYLKMPGGDACVKYPARMLASVLHEKLDGNELETLLARNYLDGFRHETSEIHVVVNQLTANKNLPLTSSAGRVLDAASAALGLCSKRTYDGEPAIRLEGFGDLIDNVDEALIENYYHLFKATSVNGTVLLDFNDGIMQLVELYDGGARKKELVLNSQAFQRAFGRFLGINAVNIARENDIKMIGFSGGVAYNKFIFSELKKTIEQSKLNFFHHVNLPAGDGGVSAGQAILASLMMI
ncbi:MAG: carbamoyltransferase HypF, partial [Promethearchaeota archaeon]